MSQTLAKDDDRHQALIRRLRASGLDAALAATLEGCSPTNPCGSGSCRKCSRPFQHACCGLVEEKIRKPARERHRNRMSALTAIPSYGRVPPGKLNVHLLQQAAEAMRAALAAAGVTAVVGIDISFNEDSTGCVASYWCVHFHGILLDWLSAAQTAVLKDSVGGSNRSLLVSPLDHRTTWDQYALKPDRFRRVSFLDNSQPHRRPFRNTRRRELYAWQAVELALVEHRYGYRQRLVTHGVEPNAIAALFMHFYKARAGP